MIMPSCEGLWDLVLHSLRNDFGAFSPLLGVLFWILHSLRIDFGAFSSLLGVLFLNLHSFRNDFRVLILPPYEGLWDMFAFSLHSKVQP
jgi:hypothetical protein